MLDPAGRCAWSCAWLLGPAFLGMVALFFLWNWLYTRWLKRVPVLDVMGIGMSFVIRATAGVMVMLPACPGREHFDLAAAVHLFPVPVSGLLQAAG